MLSLPHPDLQPAGAAQCRRDAVAQGGRVGLSQASEPAIFLISAFERHVAASSAGTAFKTANAHQQRKAGASPSQKGSCFAPFSAIHAVTCLLEDSTIIQKLADLRCEPNTTGGWVFHAPRRVRQHAGRNDLKRHMQQLVAVDHLHVVPGHVEEEATLEPLVRQLFELLSNHGVLFVSFEAGV